MAKIIIIDGLSRTGKTSICNKLEESDNGRIISLKLKMPIGLDIYSFYKGVGLISMEFYKAFPNEIFILDRSFLSELVFSNFFKRRPSITESEINQLCKENEVQLYLMLNTFEDYLKRSPKDSYIYNQNEYNLLRTEFISCETKYNKQLKNSIIIDTSNQEFTIQKSYELIKSKL